MRVALTHSHLMRHGWRPSLLPPRLLGARASLPSVRAPHRVGLGPGRGHLGTRLSA